MRMSHFFWDVSLPFITTITIYILIYFTLSAPGKNTLNALVYVFYIQCIHFQRL